MNVSITFRHMEPSEAIKDYARKRVAKLQRFLRQPMRAKVTLSVAKLHHVAEIQISSGGEHLEAKEDGNDMYASIDKVLDKLERQISAHKGAGLAKRRRAGKLPPSADPNQATASPATVGLLEETEIEG